MILTEQRLLRSFSLVLLSLAAATTVSAADNHLKVIPSTALAWGAVNHMDQTNEKIQKLAAIVQAPPVNVLDLIKKEPGIEKGLDEKGSAGFFVVPGKTEKDASVAAVFVAVADESAFRNNFDVVKTGEKISEVKGKSEPAARGASTCLAFLNGYALLSPKSDQAAITAAIEAKQNISAEMAGMESWLAENDAVVVGTVAGIKCAARQAGESLAKSRDEAANAPDSPIPRRPILDLSCKALAATPSQFSLAVAGIRCDKEGSIRITGRARLVNGCLVSSVVAGISPVKENLLSGLPGGSFVFAGGGLGIPKLLEGYMNLAIEFMKSIRSVYGMSAEEMERMSRESLTVFRQVRSVNFVMLSSKRGDSICSNMFSAMRVDNARQVLDTVEKRAASTDKLIQNAKMGFVKSMTVKRLEIAGKPALQQEMNVELSGMGAPEANRAVLDEMFGASGKMLVYYAAADEHTVVIGVGVSQERMVAALDVVRQPKKSLAGDADVSVTAAMLPADAQWVAYASPRGYMQMAQRLLSMAMKNMPGAEAFSLPPFPKSPPIGFAVKAAPDELRAEIAVPAPMLQAAGEYVNDMQRMFMERGGQPNLPPAP